MEAGTPDLMIRMIASLLVIGAVLWIAHRATRSRLTGRLGRSGLDIIGRRQLTKASSVVLVRAGERTLLLGVTDGRVDLLAEGDALDPGHLDDRATTELPASHPRSSPGSVSDPASGISVDELLAEEEFWTDPDARRRKRPVGRRTARPLRDSDRSRPHTRPKSAEASTKRGAWKRHGGTSVDPLAGVPALDGDAPARMSVIDALRERTVRRT